MSFLEAIVLGIVQGLTEFLPVSSSGHLRIVPAVFGWDDPGAAFTAVIQVGTMAAVLVYFRQDLWKVASAWLRGVFGRAREDEAQNVRMGWYLVIGTIPIVIFGLIFSDQIENEARNLYLIGTTLIVLGLLLGLADHLAKHRRDVSSVTRRDAIVIGLAQAAALVPGVSRSGATITAGLALGFKRAEAARFSFLLSVPAVVLSGVYELRNVFSESTGGAGVGDVIAATIAAFLVGYLSIAFLIKWLGEHSMNIFVGYRVIVGILVIALASSGAIS
jgi:undecaprenyl-diphosphatase